MKRLNLGCRDEIWEGWDNIDLYHDAPGVIRADVTFLPYGYETVDEIMADSILEHLTEAEGRLALRDWARVLRTGGKLTVITPDLDYVINLYGKDRLRARTQLYGTNERGQQHKWLYFEDDLVRMVEAAGFKVTKVSRDMDDLKVEATK